MNTAISIFSGVMTVICLIALLGNASYGDDKQVRRWFIAFVIFLALDSLAAGGVV